VSVFVPAAQERFIIHDVPEAVLDLLEADEFAVQGLGEEGLVRVQPESAGVTDPSHFEMARVLGRRDMLRIRARRGLPAGGRCFVIEGFVGPELVIGKAKPVEGALLAGHGRGRRLGGLRFERFV